MSLPLMSHKTKKVLPTLRPRPNDIYRSHSSLDPTFSKYREKVSYGSLSI